MKVAPLPPPGQPESCKEFRPVPDFVSDCENCPDLELVKCDIFLGSDSMENKMVFTVKNHNSKYVRSSESARFGHVGRNPVGQGASGAAPAAPSSTTTAVTVVRAVHAGVPERVGAAAAAAPSATDADVDVYPNYVPDNAMSESMPNSFSVQPGETDTYEVAGITDFPPIAACNDVVYMAVDQKGVQEPLYLWNRNYPCTVLPCWQLGFRQCTMHRGDPDKSKAGKGSSRSGSGAPPPGTGV
jgi:hypothetical protein